MLDLENVTTAILKSKQQNPWVVKTVRTYKICWVAFQPGHAFEGVAAGSERDRDRKIANLYNINSCGPSGVIQLTKMTQYIKSWWTTWVVIGSQESSHLKIVICRLTCPWDQNELTGGASGVAQLFCLRPVWMALIHVKEVPVTTVGVRKWKNGTLTLVLWNMQYILKVSHHLKKLH